MWNRRSNKQRSSFGFVLFCGIILYFCASNLSIINFNAFKRSLEAADAEELEIEGKCFFINVQIRGDRSWGNAMYYYISAIMYLLRNGATCVFMPHGTMALTNLLANPIGVPNLDGNVFGPMASSVEKSSCITIDPKYLGTGYHGVWSSTLPPNGSSMQDLMEFREQWDDIKKDWPSAPYNLNPFESDFGVEPSIELITNSLGVAWSDVLVIHIRQGDVMYRPNKTGPKMFHHSQPPCAYYEDVIETGYDGAPFPFLLIITNKVKDPVNINPCDKYIDDKYRSGQHTTMLLDYELVENRLNTVQSHAGAPGQNDGVRKDLYILTKAVNIAEGHSTFTMGTLLLNYNLKRHFYPSTPGTITGLKQAKVTIAGNWVNTRQFNISGIQQTLYVLNGWLGYNASCAVYKSLDGNLPLDQWLHKITTESESWDAEGTNFTNFALAYERSSIMKVETSNKPFQCDSVPHLKNNSNWFIPCVCDDS